jgi:hypothetical protein
VEVYKWDPEATPEGVALYATIGASELPLVGHDPAHRAEFFVGLLPAKDDIARPLAMLASHSAHEKTALDHGHTVIFLEPFWAGTSLRTFLVMRPVSEILPTLGLPGGVHVEFLQAIPLFQSELAFKKANGAEALLRRWEESGVPFWDPRHIND